ncbi:hypothetical protein [uncultured Cohaesibacter sp.]|uniref:hypothetical protein n=1 Tax=uncultured Cohaesibacter sp. TaxID=1002546 RepID=UPI0029C8826A|nr:hypothetical protein [uncultured Cohaesibacter sp.]
MRKDNPSVTTIRNHIPGSTRAIKLVSGILLLVLAFYLIFGFSFDGENPYLFTAVLIVAFLAFGFGWTFASQGVMGWSRQLDFDFDKRQMRQTSASILGRSRPFVVPFVRISGFNIQPAGSKGSSADSDEAIIEMMDVNGGVLLYAGLFKSQAAAQEMVGRIRNAVAEDADPEDRPSDHQA